MKSAAALVVAVVVGAACVAPAAAGWNADVFTSTGAPCACALAPCRMWEASNVGLPPVSNNASAAGVTAAVKRPLCGIDTRVCGVAGAVAGTNWSLTAGVSPSFISLAICTAPVNWTTTWAPAYNASNTTVVPVRWTLPPPSAANNLSAAAGFTVYLYAVASAAASPATLVKTYTTVAPPPSGGVAVYNATLASLGSSAAYGGSSYLFRVCWTVDMSPPPAAGNGTPACYDSTSFAVYDPPATASPSPSPSRAPGNSSGNATASVTPTRIAPATPAAGNGSSNTTGTATVSPSPSAPPAPGNSSSGNTTSVTPSRTASATATRTPAAGNGTSNTTGNGTTYATPSRSPAPGNGSSANNATVTPAPASPSPSPAPFAITSANVGVMLSTTPGASERLGSALALTYYYYIGTNGASVPSADTPLGTITLSLWLNNSDAVPTRLAGVAERVLTASDALQGSAAVTYVTPVSLALTYLTPSDRFWVQVRFTAAPNATARGAAPVERTSATGGITILTPAIIIVNPAPPLPAPLADNRPFLLAWRMPAETTTANFSLWHAGPRGAAGAMTAPAPVWVANLASGTNDPGAADEMNVTLPTDLLTAPALASYIAAFTTAVTPDSTHPNGTALLSGFFLRAVATMVRSNDTPVFDTAPFDILHFPPPVVAASPSARPTTAASLAPASPSPHVSTAPASPSPRASTAAAASPSSVRASPASTTSPTRSTTPRPTVPPTTAIAASLELRLPGIADAMRAYGMPLTLDNYSVPVVRLGTKLPLAMYAVANITDGLTSYLVTADTALWGRTVAVRVTYILGLLAVVQGAVPASSGNVRTLHWDACHAVGDGAMLQASGALASMAAGRVAYFTVPLATTPPCGVALRTQNATYGYTLGVNVTVEVMTPNGEVVAYATRGAQSPLFHLAPPEDATTGGGNNGGGSSTGGNTGGNTGGGSGANNSSSGATGGDAATGTNDTRKATVVQVPFLLNLTAAAPEATTRLLSALVNGTAGSTLRQSFSDLVNKPLDNVIVILIIDHATGRVYRFAWDSPVNGGNSTQRAVASTLPRRRLQAASASASAACAPPDLSTSAINADAAEAGTGIAIVLGVYVPPPSCTADATAGSSSGGGSGSATSSADAAAVSVDASATVDALASAAVNGITTNFAAAAVAALTEAAGVDTSSVSATLSTQSVSVDANVGVAAAPAASPPPAAGSGSGSSGSLAAIVGGAVGGAILIAIVIGLFMHYGGGSRASRVARMSKAPSAAGARAGGASAGAVSPADGGNDMTFTNPAAGAGFPSGTPTGGTAAMENPMLRANKRAAFVPTAPSFVTGSSV